MLDDALLAALKIDAQTPLEVTTDGAALSIKRVGVASDSSFEQALEAVNARHGSALKKLAE